MSKLFQVDAFTDHIFHGNPAAVCMPEGKKSDSWMQQLAQEMNLSETAFLFPQGKDYHLRWFTPSTEVELCGHATLASAWVLFHELQFPQKEKIRFHTLSGDLTAKWENGAVVLNFPAFKNPCELENQALLDALGIKQAKIWQIQSHCVVEVEDASIVRNLRPDFRRMVEIGSGDVAVTSLSDDPLYDFISRFFAPALGIDEDPVTGSAHCSLGPFWMEKLKKNPLHAYQASARGGGLTVEIQGERVNLLGNAVTVFQTELKD